MKHYKDPTKHAVRNVIEPFLSEHGFSRSKEKDFFRVRGELLDAIYFGFGRWGSDVIYIYYSVHLLADPVTNIDTYHVGDRISAKWFPNDHDAACVSAKKLLHDVKKYAFEWFNEIDSVKKLEGAWFDTGPTVAFTAIAQGDLNRAKIYLEDSISRKSPLIYESGYPGWRDNEYGIEPEKKEQLKLALNAVVSGAVDEWKDKVKKQRCDQLGIKYAD